MFVPAFVPVSMHTPCTCILLHLYLFLYLCSCVCNLTLCLPRTEETWKSVKEKDSVTPYLHGLEARVPEMVRRSDFGSISQFQLQGQEAKHKDQTRILMNMVDLNGNKSAIILRLELLLQYLEQDSVQNALSPQRGPKRTSKVNFAIYLPIPMM